jgi:hypothetical protein
MAAVIATQILSNKAKNSLTAASDDQTILLIVYINI